MLRTITSSSQLQFTTRNLDYFATLIVINFWKKNRGLPNMMMTKKYYTTYYHATITKNEHSDKVVTRMTSHREDDKPLVALFYGNLPGLFGLKPLLSSAILPG